MEMGLILRWGSVQVVQSAVNGFHNIFTEVDAVEIYLLGRVPCFLASPLSVRITMLQIGLLVSLFVLFGKIRQVLF